MIKSYEIIFDSEVQFFIFCKPKKILIVYINAPWDVLVKKYVFFRPTKYGRLDFQINIILYLFNQSMVIWTREKGIGRATCILTYISVLFLTQKID